MTVEIPLARGRGVALIDDENAELVAPFSWVRHSAGYAVAHARGQGNRQVYMHRLILAPPAGVQVDHINRDGLDNRRANLRLADKRQQQGNIALNARNTSGFRGVSLDSRRGRWAAHIAFNSRSQFLGYFATPEAAAHAYDIAAAAHFGEFAWLNFPPTEQGATK